jgi:hypothetical protein
MPRDSFIMSRFVYQPLDAASIRLIRLLLGRFDNQLSSLEDPRLGLLPTGWRIAYEGEKEFDERGNLNYLYVV